MDIAGAGLDGGSDHGVDEADDGSLGGHVAQVFEIGAGLLVFALGVGALFGFAVIAVDGVEDFLLTGERGANLEAAKGAHGGDGLKSVFEFPGRDDGFVEGPAGVDVVIVDLAARGLQAPVQQSTAPRAFLTVDQLYSLARQVFHTADLFRIAARQHESFFPHRECENRDALPGELRVDGGSLVFQVRAGHVDHAPLEKMQGHRAVDRRRHQPHTGALQMTRQHRRGGVAAGHQ